MGGGTVGSGRVCGVAVCGRWAMGNGWAAAGDGPRGGRWAWCAVRSVGRGAWGVGWGSNGGRHPLIPHKCSTSPSSSGATGANFTRLVTAVCPSGGSRLMLMLMGGLVTAPLGSSGLELEAKMSISSAGVAERGWVTATSALGLALSIT